MFKQLNNLICACCALAFVLSACSTTKHPARKKPVMDDESLVSMCKALPPPASIPPISIAPPAPLPVVVQEQKPVVTPPTPPPVVVEAPPVAVVQKHPAVQTQVKAIPFNPLATVHFADDSYRLNTSAKKMLNNFCQIAKKETVGYVIEGFCDESGDEAYNLALGERRSKMVAAYLIKQGIDKSRVSIVSYGKSYPVKQNLDKDNWRLNRRVEIVKIQSPKPDAPERYGKNK